MIFKYWHFLCPTHFFCQITSNVAEKYLVKRDIEPCINERKQVWAPTPLASGTIRSRLCASWGPERPLRGTNGVAAEIVVTLGCEICYWLQPGTGQTTNTWDKKMQAMCLLEPLGALIGTYGQIPWDSQIQNFYWILLILFFPVL